MYNDIIKRLCAAEGRGEKGFLSEAAEAIETLKAQLAGAQEHMKTLVSLGCPCAICRHIACVDPVYCKLAEMNCGSCLADCACKECEDHSQWEWCGVKKEG